MMTRKPRINCQDHAINWESPAAYSFLKRFQTWKWSSWFWFWILSMFRLSMISFNCLRFEFVFPFAGFQIDTLLLKMENAWKVSKLPAKLPSEKGSDPLTLVSGAHRRHQESLWFMATDPIEIEFRKTHKSPQGSTKALRDNSFCGHKSPLLIRPAIFLLLWRI
jgi:hypothetical protein